MKSTLTPWSLILKTTDMLKKISINWKLIVVYGFLFAVVFMATGHSEYGCQASLDNYWCFAYRQNSFNVNILYFTMVICSTYVFFSFVFDFYNASFNNITFKVSNILKLGRNKLKMFGRLMCMIFAFVFLIAVAAYIIMREPDPNWKIEFLYFTVAFMSVILIILGIRLSAAFCGIIEGNICEKMRQVYNQTSNKSFSIILVFLCLILCENLIYIKISDYLQALASAYDFLMIAIIFEMISGVLICVFTAVIIIFMRVQYDVIIEQIDQEQVQNVKNKEKKTIKKSFKKRIMHKTKMHQR